MLIKEMRDSIIVSIWQKNFQHYYFFVKAIRWGKDRRDVDYRLLIEVTA